MKNKIGIKSLALVLATALVLTAAMPLAAFGADLSSLIDPSMVLSAGDSVTVECGEGCDAKITASLSITGADAAITIKDSDIEYLAKKGKTESGDYVDLIIDLTKTRLGLRINSLSFSADTLSKIGSMIKDEVCDIRGLCIVFTDGSFFIDQVKGIADKAGKETVKFYLVRLSSEHDGLKMATYDLGLDFGLAAESQFYGAETASIKVPFTTDKEVKAFCLAGDGKEVDASFDGQTARCVTPMPAEYLFREEEASAPAAASAGCTRTAGSCPVAAFKDADANAWYHDGMHFCLEKGIIKGTGNGTVSPQGTLTRAQAITMLWRIAGEPVVNYAMNFSDVSEDSWYGEAVRWAVSEKVMSGYSDGTFRPNNNITREQFSVMLYGYAKKLGKGFTGSWMFLLNFDDASSISSWADEAMHWTVMKGITTGNNGKLNPGALATRAQAAEMFKRFCEAIK